jgi:hypothetical protein
MSTHLLGSTILMGLVFAGIFYALSKIGVQRSAEVADTDAVQPYASGPGERSAGVGSPQRLGAVFVVVTLALGVISVALVGGLGAGEGLAASLLGAAVGLLGLLVVGFLFGGTYSMARSHGMGQAHGVAAGLLVTGGAGILLVAANLVVGFV